MLSLDFQVNKLLAEAKNLAAILETTPELLVRRVAAACCCNYRV